MSMAGHDARKAVCPLGDRRNGDDVERQRHEAGHDEHHPEHEQEPYPADPSTEANYDDDFSCSSAGSPDVYFHFAAGDYLIGIPSNVAGAVVNECPRTTTPSLCFSPFPSSLTMYTFGAEKWLAIEPRGSCGEYTINVIAL